MWSVLILLLYSVALILASLLGGWLPSRAGLTHTRMQLMMSLVGGLMIGVAVLHLLPHAVVETGSMDLAASACLFGLVAMFLTIRVFPVHQHCPGHADVREVHHIQHGSACQDSSPHEEGQACGESGPARYSWIGIFLGLSIHTAIDGVAVAASVAACSVHESTFVFLGAATFLAVFLHKPLDSFSLMSVMLASHWKRSAQNAINLVFALICPVAALIFFFSARELTTESHTAIGCALGFSAGVFLCISLADILPEIQFHRHDRVALTGALLLGIALSYAVGLFEPSHAHEVRSEHQHSSAVEPEHHDDLGKPNHETAE